jgi:uncharacterized membrane protein YdjX (TVP38/TMEM64 family)
MSKPQPHGRARRRLFVAILILAAVMLALIAAWKWSPLHDIAEPRAVARWLGTLADTPLLPLFLALVYVGASLVMFPNTVLCLGVILALGPIEGAIYAYGGSMTAALVGYGLGRRGGKRVESLRFQRFEHVSRQLRRGGFLQVLMLRLLPIAPFTATNILSGASRVPVFPYAAATLVGISWYILAFAVFGRQARSLFANPTPTNVAVTVAVAVLLTCAVLAARSLAAARAK